MMTNDALANQNSVGNSIGRSVRNPRRAHPSADVDFRGKYLLIQPGDELVFENRGPERDSTDIIRLTNTSASFVAFKVKTTAPEKFRVRPSFGCIERGGSQTVEIAIQPGFLMTAQRDKFLVMSTPLESVPRNNSELVDYWHELLRDEGMAENVEEHRLRCSIISNNTDGLNSLDTRIISEPLPVPAAAIPPVVMDKLDIISAKVDRLMALQQLDKDAPLLKKQWNLIAAGIFFVIIYVGVSFVQVLFGR